MFKSFKEMADAAKSLHQKMVLAVVEAQEAHTLEAVIKAQRDGIVQSILIGDAKKIRDILEEEGEKADSYEIVPADGNEESLQIAVDLIHAGKANAIMKGNLETGQFMRAIVKKDNKLTKGGRVSLVGLYEHPNYHKLLAITDQGMNINPDLETKKELINNAVEMLHALGNECPKVACLCAVETVNPKMQETVDAESLKQYNQNGEIPGCIVEGPVSFDLAVKKNAASIKGFESPVAGDADLLLVPNISCGNILAKCMTDYAGAVTAGTVLGAKCPVVLTSRSAEVSDKYYSIALAVYVAGVC